MCRSCFVFVLLKTSAAERGLAIGCSADNVPWLFGMAGRPGNLAKKPKKRTTGAFLPAVVCCFLAAPALSLGYYWWTGSGGGI